MWVTKDTALGTAIEHFWVLLCTEKRQLYPQEGSAGRVVSVSVNALPAEHMEGCLLPLYFTRKAGQGQTCSASSHCTYPSAVPKPFSLCVTLSQIKTFFCQNQYRPPGLAPMRMLCMGLVLTQQLPRL